MNEKIARKIFESIRKNHKKTKTQSGRESAFLKNPFYEQVNNEGAK